MTATSPTAHGHVSGTQARRLRFMSWFIRVAGIYNASAVVVLLTPGALELGGTFTGLLALGDLPLALGAIIGLPRALGRTHWSLLTNRLAA